MLWYEFWLFNGGADLDDLIDWGIDVRFIKPLICLWQVMIIRFTC